MGAFFFKDLVMDDQQVLYLDRWVSREHFRTFVYNKEGQKLVKSYDEYCQAISSGLWTATPYKEIQESQFTEDELNESKQLDEVKPSIIEQQLDDKNVVEIKPKKGRPCLNQKKV